MYVLTRSSRRIVQQRVCRRQKMSTSPLESDTGALGTRIHHRITEVLAVMTPLYFLTPDSYTDGVISKAFGLLLSVNITAHSWIGLNYVARDYVPKISSKLLGPARIATLGLSAITLLGMAKISIMSPGGLKGVVKGVWKGDSKKKNELDF